MPSTAQNTLRDSVTYRFYLLVYVCHSARFQTLGKKKKKKHIRTAALDFSYNSMVTCHNTKRNTNPVSFMKHDKYILQSEAWHISLAHFEPSV